MTSLSAGKSKEGPDDAAESRTSPPQVFEGVIEPASYAKLPETVAVDLGRSAHSWTSNLNLLNCRANFRGVPCS